MLLSKIHFSFFNRNRGRYSLQPGNLKPTIYMESDFLSKISIKFDLEAKLEAHSLDDPCWVVAHKP